MDFYDGPDFPKGEGLPPVSLGSPEVIYPGVDTKQPLSGNSRITTTGFERLLDGQTRIYVWGLFDYETLGRNVYTKFCYYATFKKDFPTAEWIYVPCEEGNESN